MGKTKIIIEMPTMLYLTLKLDGVWGYPRLTEIIRNGKPLPKGHGRIIDESKIEVCEWVNELEEDYPKASTDAPTIIEADKGEGDAE